MLWRKDVLNRIGETCHLPYKLTKCTSIFQRVLIDSKGWCIGTLYHPFSTLWKIQVGKYTSPMDGSWIFPFPPIIPDVFSSQPRSLSLIASLGKQRCVEPAIREGVVWKPRCLCHGFKFPTSHTKRAEGSLATPNLGHLRLAVTCD